MSLLQKLFKSKPRVFTVEERIAALETKSASELAAIATGTMEDIVREAATKRLSYGDDLLKLATHGESSRVLNTARQRVGQLLEKGDVSVVKLRQDLGDLEQLFALVSYSVTSSAQLIGEVTDESFLLKIATDASTTQTRQLAAQKINGRGVLEALYKNAKSRDKAVYKIAKTKLEVFKQRDAKIAAQLAVVEKFVIDAERHAEKPYDAIYLKRLTLIENNWHEMEKQASPDLKERYYVASQKCSGTLNEHNEAEDARKQQERLDEQAATNIVSANTAIQKLILFLLEAAEVDEALESAFKMALAEQDAVVKQAKLRGLASLEPGLDAYYRVVEEVNSLWFKLQQTGSLSGVIESLNDASKEQAQAIVKAARQLLNFVKDDDELPELIQAAKNRLYEWEQMQKARAQKIKQDISDISTLVRRANHSVEHGFIRKARGIHKDLNERCEHFSGTLPLGLSTRIEQLEERISKLGDWHTFATTPKKELLVEQMGVLIGASLAPQDLAEKIHSLQQEWKTLCRGGENQDQELWEKFQAAADKAYEPCQEYFDAQSKEREANAEKRRELIAQLELYFNEYDWDNAVWKDVEQTIKVARDTWQSHWPIPRKLSKILQKDFDTIVDKIYAPMNNAYSQGRSDRERLVEQAKMIAEKEGDIVGRAEEIKKLQDLWKKAGRTRRKDDQILWKTFREYCDLVFAARQQQYDEKNAERDVQLSKAEVIIEQVESLLNFKGAEFFSALHKLDEIKQRFAELGGLPRNKERSIQSRFTQALTSIEHKIQKEKHAGVEKAWGDWFDTAERLRLLELSILQGAHDEEEYHALEDLLGSDTQWPTGGLLCLQERFKHLNALQENSDSEREERLRLLCIQAEVMCDVETPDEDKERRMQYQVAQLQKGMGQGADIGDITRLTLDWFKVPAVADLQYQPLYERFMKCRAEALA